MLKSAAGGGGLISEEEERAGGVLSQHAMISVIHPTPNKKNSCFFEMKPKSVVRDGVAKSETRHVVWDRISVLLELDSNGTL
jgi:hypothetical protein